MIGSLVGLLPYVFGAIAVFAFLAWGNNLLKHHYVDPVVAEHKAETTSYKATIDNQARTIETQGSSLADVTRKAGECSASVERIAGIAKARGDEADKLRALAVENRAKAQRKIDELAALAAAPGAAASCEQQIQRVREIGDEYARDVLGIPK